MDNDMEEMISLIRQDLQQNHGLNDKLIDVLFEKTQFLEICKEDPKMIFHYSQDDWSKELLKSVKNFSVIERYELSVRFSLEENGYTENEAKKMIEGFGENGLKGFIKEHPSALHYEPKYLAQE